MKREKEWEDYKEDSTKGSSLIKPLNYKGDVLVQVWVDSRVLATLCRWMDEQGEYARFMSQVVRRPLEVLAEFVSDQGSEMIDDTGEARKMLERRFGVNLNRGGRGSKNVMHNLVLSDKRNELNERIVSRVERRGLDKRVRGYGSGDRSELVKKAMEVYGRIERGESVEDIRNNNVGDEIIVKEKMTSEEIERKRREIERKDKEREEAERKALEEVLAGMKSKSD